MYSVRPSADRDQRYRGVGGLVSTTLVWLTVGSPNTSSQLISPYKRSTEIDLLQPIAKKQNDEVARARVFVARNAILQVVQLGKSSDGVWESPAQLRIMQILQVEAAKLEPFLEM